MMAQGCASRPVIERAAEALRAGTPILIVHGTDELSAADVVISAAHATPHWTAWLVRFTSGLICAALPARRAEELDLPPMARDDDSDVDAPAFAVAVDAASGIGTGISAIDRARTARVLASDSSKASDLVRPGHVLPVKVAGCGVLKRCGIAEATVDLCDIAGLPPVGLIAALLGEDGELLREPAVSAFAQNHDLPMVHIDSVVHHRLFHGDGRRKRVMLVQNRLDQLGGRPLRAVDFEDQLTGARHTVFIGASTSGIAPHVHVLTECVHRNALVASDCECRVEFERCHEHIAVHGGVIVYLRSPITSAPRFSVPQPELVAGCITAMLIELGFTAVTLTSSAQHAQLKSACELVVSGPAATSEPGRLSAAAP